MTERINPLNLDEITEIEYLGKIQTYDLTIPKTHCFYANDILVHNTGALEQMADKVILVYGTEDPAGNKKNFINLAKNRQGEKICQEVIFQGWIYKFKEFPYKPY